MYVITNRRLDSDEGDLSIFSKEPSKQGPNELRLVKVVKSGNKHKASLLDDKLTKTRVKDIKKKYELDIDESVEWYQSLEMAAQLFEHTTKNNKHILIFVHGYNIDMGYVSSTA